jgi:hypothetical protein
MVAASVLLALVAPLSARPSSRKAADATQTRTELQTRTRCEHYDDASERACFAQTGNIASRQGSRLDLKLDNGKTKSFTSTFDACEGGQAGACVSYRLAGYFPAHRLVLIDVAAIEGGHWLLVSRRSGNETRLEAPPNFSPGGNRFISVSASEVGENGIDIWSNSDPPKLEWRYRVPEDEYALYRFTEWRGDDRVMMTVLALVGRDLKTLPAEVVRLNGIWELKRPSP